MVGRSVGGCIHIRTYKQRWDSFTNLLHKCFSVLESDASTSLLCTPFQFGLLSKADKVNRAASPPILVNNQCNIFKYMLARYVTLEKYLF